MYVRNLPGAAKLMAVAKDDDEITYGPKKLGANDLIVTSGLVIVGIAMIWSGASGQMHGDVSIFRNDKTIFAGVLAVIMGVAGAVLRILGTRRNTPHVTMYSTGLSYAMGVRTVLESRWDSVGPFELVYDAKGKLNSIQAPITGENISENLRKESNFGIYFLKLLDVEPTVLVSELNQVRANALGKSDK
jgi:hypothetical protein